MVISFFSSLLDLQFSLLDYILNWIEFLYSKLVQIYIKHSSHHMICNWRELKKFDLKRKDKWFWCIEDQIMPIWAMWFSQSLQRQASGFQNLIKLLNSFSELDSLIFWVFPSTFVRPVPGVKNSILDSVLKLNPVKRKKNQR